MEKIILGGGRRELLVTSHSAIHRRRGTVSSHKKFSSKKKEKFGRTRGKVVRNDKQEPSHRLNGKKISSSESVLRGGGGGGVLKGDLNSDFSVRNSNGIGRKDLITS